MASVSLHAPCVSKDQGDRPSGPPRLCPFRPKCRKSQLRSHWASLDEAKLVAPLGSTWWSKAELNKQWGKPVVTVSSESRLERLDMKFAAEHAKKATTSPSVLEMSEDETGAPYLLLEQTLLQCVYIAEQLGAIPPLDDKWLARVISPSLRQLSQLQKSTGLH